MESLAIVQPISPAAAYLGGKRNLARRLCALIGATPHRSYIEPFVGMGGVFLRRSRRPAVEVINDLSGDVANLFRIVRRHYGPLVDELAFLPASRDEFERQRRLDPEALTDIERAVRFLYLQRLAFGGRVEGRTFGVRKGQSSQIQLAKLRANLKALSRRLEGRTFGVRKDQSARIQLAQLRADLKALSRRLEPVTIERLPYGDVIRRYDAPGALFYLDPPYDETEGYGVAFGRADYVAMAEQLAGIRGSFLMSINATSFVRETFAAFDIQEIETTWTLSSASAGRGQRVTELLIRNRPH